MMRERADDHFARVGFAANKATAPAVEFGYATLI
jgi:hypothetical protein